MNRPFRLKVQVCVIVFFLCLLIEQILGCSQKKVDARRTEGRMLEITLTGTQQNIGICKTGNVEVLTIRGAKLNLNKIEHFVRSK